MKQIDPIIYDSAGLPVWKATVRLNVSTNAWITDMTDENGEAKLIVDDSLQNTQFECYSCNHKPLGVSIDLKLEGNKQIRVGLAADPSRPQDIILPALQRLGFNWTREELLLFRGSLNISSTPIENVSLNRTVSTNFSWHGTDEDVDLIIGMYKNRKYTHGPAGPFIDGGYHGLIPATDFRGDVQRERIEQVLTHLQESGIITPIFLTPDNWTVEQLRTLEPIFKSDTWQRLGSIVVNGFEQQGSRYGWSNSQYVEYLSWVKEVFPNAVRGLHTNTSIEAPVGRGDDTNKPGMSLNECWGRLNPLIDFWLTQFDMWDDAWIHIDPNNPDGKTDLEHWLMLWDKTDKNSFIRRFSETGSWPLAKDIIPIPGEFWSYGLVWRNLPELQGQRIGAKAIQFGAHGSFDGC